MNDIELSLIILCYRSGETVREFVSRAESIVSSLTDRCEIILVGNYIVCNSDCTKEVVGKLAEESFRYKAICLPKSGMMGWDMRLGLEAAQGDYLCVIDGDGQFPLESIAQCYQTIKTGEYDLVKTYRHKRHDGFYRASICRIYNGLFSLLFPGLGSRDINSKPKMLTRNAYHRMEITSDDWFVDAEIMLNVRRYKMAFFEFPVDFEALAGRASFVRFDAIFEFVKNLIRYRLLGFRNQKVGK